ncbi:MAG: Flagellin protein FlaA [Candidatus Ozemobacter sibiricus]|jgi:flagellin|uniref:Flagellin n=1 Tax=Candidatus Ozemobacter sibiricus TaxID=2268124 RepID=A0A367ZF53_9BACT|nr:MAG: Flagellin protein FlaA [Candidatus Ozemobacter sibiricus]
MMVDRTATTIATTLSNIQDAQARTLERIATGKQILSGADDPAGLAMTMTLEAQMRGLNQQITIRQDEISLLQTAEGALGTTGEMIQRLRELAVQAANGTLTPTDRQAIQAEIGQLNEAITRVATDTQYNTRPLLNGTFSMQLQNGNVLSIPGMAASDLRTATIDVTTPGGAQAAVATADQALQTVTGTRSTIGAVINGLTSEIQGLQNQYANTVAATAQIADADIARQLIALTTQRLQSEAALRTFKIDDQMRGSVLKLLG